MDEAALLEGLDGAQREAVLTDASPLVILAPAGSGKTRVVSHRIARRVLDGSADAQHVLAITFTRRAAGELQRRLGRLGLRGRPTAGTFHGVAWAVLTQRWSDQRRARPELLTDRVRLLETVVGQLVPTRRVASVRVEAVASELDWARARLVPPERYAEEARRGGRKPPLPPDLLAEVFSAYADEKRKRRVVDFDDLLELCAAELDHQPDFAASQRWRFRHLFVDEFQDVNPLQFRLLEAWRGGRPDLCVVGDPNQAIYGWNGADPSLLLRLPSLVGGATVVRLDRSYRSTPQVLTTAAALLPDGEAPAAVRADGPAPEVHGFATEHDEARAIAALLAERRPGRRWSSCAVLVRTRAQVGPIERALRQASIPVRLRHDRPLLDLPGVQAALRQGDGAEPLGNVLEELEHRLATGAAEAAPDEAEPAGLAPAVLARARAAERQPVGHARDLPGLAGRGRRRRRRRSRRRRRAHLPRRQGPGMALGRRGRRRGRPRPPPLGHRRRGPGRGDQAPLRRAHPCRARAPLHVGPVEGSRRPARAQALSPARAGPRRGDATAGRAAAVGPPAGVRRRPTGADGPAPVAGPLGPRGRRPRARGLLRRPALRPRDGPSDHPRRAGGRPRAGGGAATGAPPAPRAGGLELGRSQPDRSLRACISPTKTSGSTDTNKASASAVRVSPSWRVAEV